MTNRNVGILVLVLLAVFALDALWLEWNLPVILGKWFIATVEYLSFWR